MADSSQYGFGSIPRRTPLRLVDWPKEPDLEALRGFFELLPKVRIRTGLGFRTQTLFAAPTIFGTSLLYSD